MPTSTRSWRRSAAVRSGGSSSPTPTPTTRPGAAGLKERTGAPRLGFRPGRPRMASGLDGHDRGRVSTPIGGTGRRAPTPPRAVHTPGHASNHLCFAGRGGALLFSGDHVMQGSTVVIAPPDGDMAAYLESLATAAARRAARHRPRSRPAHRGPRRPARRVPPPPPGPGGRRSLARPGPEPASAVEDIVAAIYVDVPDALHPVARYSVWAHLRKLAADGRAHSPDPDDLAATWALRPRA